MNPESRIVRKIKEAIKGRGHFVVKFHGDQYTMAGMPDLVVCVEGWFLGMEVKTPQAIRRANHGCSPRQMFVHELIRKSGGFVCVVSSVGEALRVIREVEAHARSMIQSVD